MRKAEILPPTSGVRVSLEKIGYIAAWHLQSNRLLLKSVTPPLCLLVS